MFLWLQSLYEQASQTKRLVSKSLMTKKNLLYQSKLFIVENLDRYVTVNTFRRFLFFVIWPVNMFIVSAPVGFV